MLRVTGRRLLRSSCISLQSFSTSSHRLINGISSYDDLKKVNETIDEKKDDPYIYNIFGRKRKKVDIYHYTNRKVGRGYWDYSTTVYQHRPKVHPAVKIISRYYLWFLTASIIFMVFDFQWFVDIFQKMSVKFRPEAAEFVVQRIPSEEAAVLSPQPAEDGMASEKKKKKKKIGFRERRIIEYENRIRMYSAPEKIFRYFATLKVLNEENSSRPYEIFMTPQDFVRSLTPGIMQPRGLGLDKFKIFDPSKQKHASIHPSSVFTQLDENALISFTDYLFLVTVLSTSPNDFALAFRIFDLNGDGELDKQEFERVQVLVMSQSNVGQRHRDRAAVGLYPSKHINSALSSYFFGEDGSKKLSAQTFLDFQAQLQRDTLKIEYDRRLSDSSIRGKISEVSFADLLLVYSGIPTVKQRKMLKRVKKKFKTPTAESAISISEIESFFHFLYHIEDVDLALHFFNIAGAGVTGDVLKLIAKKVIGTEISDHVINVVVTLFDENEQ